VRRGRHAAGLLTRVLARGGSTKHVRHRVWAQIRREGMMNASQAAKAASRFCLARPLFGVTCRGARSFWPSHCKLIAISRFPALRWAAVQFRSAFTTRSLTDSADRRFLHILRASCLDPCACPDGSVLAEGPAVCRP